MYISIKSVTQSLFFCVLFASFLQAHERISPCSPEIRESSESASGVSCCRFHKRQAKKHKKYTDRSPKKTCRPNKEKDTSDIPCCHFHTCGNKKKKKCCDKLHKKSYQSSTEKVTGTKPCCHVHGCRAKKHKKLHVRCIPEKDNQSGDQKPPRPLSEDEVDKKKVSSPSPHAIIAEIYANVSGNKITTAEIDLIKKKGGNPTYGEIKPESLTTLLQELGITKDDVLYDLGSGTGKVVVQSCLEFPFKKVVGIELCQNRHEKATHALGQLKQRGFIKKKHSIHFIQGDIVETPCKDATVIFMCSTCFSDELMTKLAEKISQLKKGTRVITLKRLPNPKKYKLAFVREYRLAMSWSTPEGSPVYVYEKIS